MVLLLFLTTSWLTNEAPQPVKVGQANMQQKIQKTSVWRFKLHSTHTVTVHKKQRHSFNAAFKSQAIHLTVTEGHGEAAHLLINKARGSGAQWLNGILFLALWVSLGYMLHLLLAESFLHPTYLGERIYANVFPVTSGMTGVLCRWQVMYTIKGQSLGCIRTPAAWAQVGWNAVEQRPWEHCTQQPFTSFFIRFLQNTHFCTAEEEVWVERKEIRGERERKRVRLSARAKREAKPDANRNVEPSGEMTNFREPLSKTPLGNVATAPGRRSVHDSYYLRWCVLIDDDVQPSSR